MFLTKHGFKNKTNCGKLIRGGAGDARNVVVSRTRPLSLLSSEAAVKSGGIPEKRVGKKTYAAGERDEETSGNVSRKMERESAIEVYRRRTDEETSKKRSRERERERERDQRRRERDKEKEFEHGEFYPKLSFSLSLRLTSSLAFVHDLSLCLFVALSGTNVFLFFFLRHGQA